MSALTPQKINSLYPGFGWGGPLLLILVLMQWCPASLGLEALEIRPDQHRKVLGPGYLEMSETPVSPGDLETLLSGQLLTMPFRPVNRVSILPGMDRSERWFRWRLTNPGPVPARMVIDLGSPAVERADLYIFSDRQYLQHLQTGMAVPKQERLIRNRFFVIPLDVAPGETTYYLRMVNTAVRNFSIAIASEENYINYIEKIGIRVGIFYGLLITLFLAAALGYLAGRKPVHLTLVGAITFTGLIYAHSDGLVQQLINVTYWQQQAVEFCYLCAKAICFVLFFRFYFPPTSYSPGQQRALQIGWLTGLVVIVLQFMVPLSIGAVFATIYTQLMPVALCVLLYSFRGKEPINGFLVGAMGFYLSDYTLGILYGTVPSLEFNNYIIYSRFASLATMTLMALALLRKFNEARVATLLEVARLKDAEANMRAKDQFLAAMSHEIRTPMNGVIGMVDILRNTPLNEQQREYIDIVAESGNSLLEVINEVLDFSKIESGNMDIYSYPFDLRKMVAESVMLLNANAQSKNISLQYEVTEALAPMVMGDQTRVRQVILNLIGNAIKFTERGEVRVRVSLEAAGETPQLVIDVTDTGVGVAESDLGELFMSFRQASHQHGGTGLGLAISRQLTELMGGQITANSTVGKGSTFTVRLPYRPVTAEAASVHIHEQEIDLPKLRILLAEDNVINQKVALTMLTNMGMQVDCVVNGEQALQILRDRHHPYEVVLMDCDMPELDGYEATRQLRASERGGDRHTYVIALTAHALREYRELALEVGMDAYLSKPLKQRELYLALAEYTKQPKGPAA